MLKYIAKFEALIGFFGSSLIALSSLIYDMHDTVPIYIIMFVIIVSFSIIWGLIIYIGILKKRNVLPYAKVIRFDKNKIIFVTNIKDFLLEGGYIILYAKINEIHQMIGVVKIEHIQEKFVQGIVKCKLKMDGLIDKRKLAIRTILRPEDVMMMEEVDEKNEGR